MIPLLVFPFSTCEAPIDGISFCACAIQDNFISLTLHIAILLLQGFKMFDTGEQP